MYVQYKNTCQGSQIIYLNKFIYFIMSLTSENHEIKIQGSTVQIQVVFQISDFSGIL